MESMRIFICRSTTPVIHLSLGKNQKERVSHRGGITFETHIQP